MSVLVRKQTHSCSANDLSIKEINPAQARLLPQLSLNEGFMILVKINYFHIEAAFGSANIGIRV